MCYVPFNTEEDDCLSPKVQTSKSRNEQGLAIAEFIEKIFGDRKTLSYNEYKDININYSSEMFFSMMRVLHNTLPCTANFFRLKKKYFEAHDFS